MVPDSLFFIVSQIADAIEGAILTARLHEEEEKRHTLSQVEYMRMRLTCFLT